MLEQAQHGTLVSIFIWRSQRWNHLDHIIEVYVLSVNQDPLIFLETDSNRMPLHILIADSNGLSVSIDHLVAKISQLSVIKVIDMVKLLQANQACTALLDFFHDTSRSKSEIKDLGALRPVEFWSG